MKIEFVRTGDRYFTEVARDDGAVVRLRAPGGTGLPGRDDRPPRDSRV